MGVFRSRSLRAQRVSMLGALAVVAASAHATELTPNPQLQLSAPGLNYAIGGVGLRDVPEVDGGFVVSTPRLVRGADFNLSLDVQGPIERAFLYWGGRGELPGDTFIGFEGSQVKGTLIGTEFTRTLPGANGGDDQENPQSEPSQMIVDQIGQYIDKYEFAPAEMLLPNTTAYVYAADVTSIVNDFFSPPGLLRVTVEDLTPGEEDSEIDGATLLVVYRDAGDTRSYRLSVWDGCDFAYAPRLPGEAGFAAPVTFTYGAASLDRTADLAIVCGDSTFDRPDRIDISDNPSIIDPLDASSGPQWDTDIYTINVPAGVTSTTVECVSPPEFGITADSLIWSVAVFRAPCDGVIGDLVWNDIDGDGVQDGGEPGMSALPVQLFQINQSGRAQLVAETTTSLLGEYVFTGLCAGEYRVVVNNGSPPAGFEETTPFAGGDPELDSNNVTGQMSVTLDDDTDNDRSIDCGYRATLVTGGCCLMDGTCLETSVFTCMAQGGTYQGDTTTCVEVNCPQPGACCLADGTCRMETVIGGSSCVADGGTYQGNNSVCASTFCAQPGACCLADGSCRIESAIGGALCVADGGVYQGDDTICAETNCIGACCLPDGNCIATDPALCIGQAGVYQGLGTACISTSCPQPGACCLPDGTCRMEAVINGSSCVADGGTYQGNGTTCATVTCPGGACCMIDGTCIDDTTLAACDSFSGIWQGPGSTCASADCTAPGACCLPDGTCEIARSIGGNSCAALGGTYQGDETVCAAVSCPAGACCLPNGLCDDGVSEPACTAAGGVWGGLGTVCATTSCPQPGACCLIDGTCIMLTTVGASDCIAQGGDFQGNGSDCAVTNCVQPFGACCNIDGTCSIEVKFNCEVEGGTFMGAFTTCNGINCPPPGACCLADGSCVEVIATWCATIGGTYSGDDTLCAGTNCPQPEGACCLADGVCIIIDGDGCAAAGGAYSGDGTVCASVTCVQPGACCLADGTCRQEVVIGGSSCVADGGTYQGDDTTCATSNCPGGACCLNDGACVEIVSLPFCDAAGGAWQGLGSACAAGLCPLPGACCFPDGLCRDEVTIGGALCAADGGLYQGDDTACSISTCPQPGACCLPDGTCRQELFIGGAQCAADGGTYQGNGTTCATVTCPVGACCLTDGVCVELAEADCLSAGGAWQGVIATCATVACPQPGSCCLSDGTCRQELVIGGAQCAADGGTYQGDDTSCSAVTCPGGACCMSDGSCIVLSQPDCLAMAGIWQGVNTVCTPNPCPLPGACCFPDGTCAMEADTGGAFCVAMAGVYQGDGSSCATVSCPGGACCFGDGSCVVQNEPDCENAGGIWQGLNTVCVAATCPPAGACCFPSGTCAALTSASCTDAGGTWSGGGTLCINVTCSTPPSRGNSSQKGSLLVFSKVEIRWDAAGALIQDTFIQLTNDFNNDVQVQLYFINGDAPIPATGNDRAHPGWNWVDVLIHLTGDQTTTWAASTGQPAGVSPFTVLDPGIPPGRPVDPANPNGERMLRGYVIGFAVNGLGQQIKWNHLAGEVTIVHYGLSHAWSYMAYGFAVANPAIAHGQVAGPVGQLVLDGVTYEAVPDMLLMNFDASNLDPDVDTDSALTLHAVSADLRQETDGPVTTKASFEVWNQNEVKFSGAHRCITCWDCVLLSQFDAPNHFQLNGLQTNKGKARIQGLKSQLCDVDFDPNNNGNFPFPPGPGDPTDARDIISQKAALLGVRVKYLLFNRAAAGGNLVGMGYEPALVQYDVMTFPPSAPTVGEVDPRTPTPVEKSFDELLRSIAGGPGPEGRSSSE